MKIMTSDELFEVIDQEVQSLAIAVPELKRTDAYRRWNANAPIIRSLDMSDKVWTDHNMEMFRGILRDLNAVAALPSLVFNALTAYQEQKS